MSGLNMVMLGRMEPMLERIFEILSQRAHGLRASREHDEEEPEAWARLRMEL